MGTKSNVHLTPDAYLLVHGVIVHNALGLRLSPFARDINGAYEGVRSR